MLKRFDSYPALAAALREIALSGSIKIISFDVFDTLVHRRMAPELVVHGVCNILHDHLAQRGLSAPAPLLICRHEAYMDLVTKHVAAGLDPDTTLDELAPAWVARAAGGRLDENDVANLGQQIAETEINLERQVCYVNPWLKDALPELKAAGVAVHCISDMYLGERYVRRILDDCGVSPWLDAVHVSGDHRLLKRTGRLYPHIGRSAELPEDKWLHVGDNFLADGLMAIRGGIRAWIVNDTTVHDEARRMVFDAGRYRADPHWAGFIAAGYAQTVADPLRCAEEAYGRKVLGPIFTTFVHRVLERCRDEGVSKVYFLAREGHVLKALYQHLAPLVFPDSNHPPAVYLAVSRLTALLAAMRGYGLRELAAVTANSGHPTLHDLLTPLRLAPATVEALAARNGIADANAPLPSPLTDYPPLLRLIDDPELQDHIAALNRDAKEHLHAYLQQTGWFDHERIAVVDIGWGGQIQDSLYSSLRTMAQRPQIHGFYLGANAHAVMRNCEENRIEGLLADYRRPNWSSFAAFEFVFAFEAASRAPHGTTIGYCTTPAGDIAPMFKADDTPSRRAEAADDGFIALLQSGILDYAARYAECAAILRWRGEDMLPYARTMIERLVRFPTRQEAAWWMRLSNVADLGSTATRKLGSESIGMTLASLRFRLRDAPFQYGVIGQTAGRLGQIALATLRGVRHWRIHRAHVAPAAEPQTGKATDGQRIPAESCPPWEAVINDAHRRLIETASRTPVEQYEQQSTNLTPGELLPPAAAYAISRRLATLRGIRLPASETPSWWLMVRRQWHARHNLHARLALLGRLLGR